MRSDTSHAVQSPEEARERCRLCGALAMLELSAGNGSCRLSPTQFWTDDRQPVATYNGNQNFRRSASAKQTIARVKYPCCSKQEGALKTDVIADRICPRASAQGRG
jgi:hypothetical protein